MNRVSSDKIKPTYTRRLKDAWSEQDILELPQWLRPKTCETLDLILRKRIYLLQSRRGYRANTDSNLLAFFSSKSHIHSQHPIHTLDLGAGNGLVSVLFGRSRPTSRLTLLELQPDLACRAKKNLALNDLDGSVITHDIGAGLPKSLYNSFDVVLLNPPFYSPNTRAPPKRLEKRLAHIESTAGINEFCQAAAHALRKSSNSRLYVVYDLREFHRLALAIARADLRILTTQKVSHSHNESPTRILISAGPVDEVGENRVELEQICLHPLRVNLYQYHDEIEEFLENLPAATLKIGQLRP